LHWTGPAQNWNYMCADCHSTNLRKSYQAKDDRFETTWSDINVSCEACHGPGSSHIEWAKNGKDAAAADARRGLAVQLRDPSAGKWEFAPGQSIARRTRPAGSRVEVDTCARCHSRRAQISDQVTAGQPLAQTHRVALLDEHLYHPDGQMLDEVYEYGSFVQSKMYHAGVTCSDCHDPHSLRLHASGNELCARCHMPATYDRPQHHFHKAGTAAAQCVSCHMSEHTYMVVDGRRDHSFRVPRPDLSVKLETPNACNGCHTDRTAQWATDAIAKRSGADRTPAWHYGEALYAGRTARPDAETQLLRAIDDAAVPAIARATAVALLAEYLTAKSLPVVQRSLQDSDPLMRRAATETVSVIPPNARIALALPLLRDPIRTVRLEALASLLDVPRSAFSPEQQAVVDQEIREYREIQAFNADRADAHTNLGMLEARLANPSAAQSEFTTAIRLQPSFLPAYVHLADLYRMMGQEADVQNTLRRAVAVGPESADVREALGLSLVRQKRIPEALAELAKAAALQPDRAQYAYVYAVALHDSGDSQAAVEVLTRAYQRNPGAREILVALTEYEAQAGHRDAALGWAHKLVELLPDDPEARRLVRELERGQ
jgi:tetratricopeptide (TPR) repeat protein